MYLHFWFSVQRSKFIYELACSSPLVFNVFFILHYLNRLCLETSNFLLKRKIIQQYYLTWIVFKRNPRFRDQPTTAITLASFSRSNLVEKEASPSPRVTIGGRLLPLLLVLARLHRVELCVLLH